jgi:hypothetical protein
MDYEVFLLSRVHEAWIETGDPHRAVAVGIGATARVITTAAAIMVVVFASFVLSTDPTVKMLAIGMAFAVLIDASLVRMILVPSIMALLDARAWWMPRWMEPIVPQLQLEGSTAPAASAAPVAPAPAGPAQTTAATDTEAETATAAVTDTEAVTDTAAETATAADADTEAETATAAEAEPAEAETGAERETEAATDTEAETATASRVRRPPSAK